MSIKTDKLLITSDFYSVQGEGISSGIPSYFVRLGVCNLSCGMSKSFFNQVVKDKNLEDGEIFEGDLQKEGKATWTCDSTSQWAWRGEDKDFQYLIDRWKEQGIYEDICNGTIHIIWTGGEPTIPNHQKAIVNFCNYWEQLEGYMPGYHEIETNGTYEMSNDLFKIIDQINCSPKLANSGMTHKQRVVPKALLRVMDHKNYQFKFVVSTEEDIQEMLEDYVQTFYMPMKNVVAMPGLDDQADFHERTNFILEMAKKYKFRGLSRLHISAWDKTLNV
jgi:7-carboxy-7-deazaguanine synthase